VCPCDKMFFYVNLKNKSHVHTISSHSCVPSSPKLINPSAKCQLRSSEYIHWPSTSKLCVIDLMTVCQASNENKRAGKFTDHQLIQTRLMWIIRLRVYLAIISHTWHRILKARVFLTPLYF
jgi:hypothetical protein